MEPVTRTPTVSPVPELQPTALEPMTMSEPVASESIALGQTVSEPTLSDFEEIIACASQGTQVIQASTEVTPETVEAIKSNSDNDTDTVGLLSKVNSIISSLAIPLEIEGFIHSSKLSLKQSGPQLQMHGTTSWDRHYTFLLNGQLYAEYDRLSGMLGLPSCSDTTWRRIVEGLEEHVTELAEWSCKHVREAIKTRNDHHKWVASFDGFYLTRGHHSNNSSS